LDLNVVSLVGRLVKAPQLVPAGHRGEEHCTFTIAINRVVAGQEGPQADYIPCSLWGESARNLVEGADKGDTLGIKGRIRTNFVQKADGSKSFFWEVRCDEVQLGFKSLRNLSPKAEPDATARAVRQLSKEFGG